MARTNTVQGEFVRIESGYQVSGFELGDGESLDRDFAAFDRNGRGRRVVALQAGERYVALTDDGESGFLIAVEFEDKRYACSPFEDTYVRLDSQLAMTGS